jgi:hypothetical protein
MFVAGLALHLCFQLVMGLARLVTAGQGCTARGRLMALQAWRRLVGGRRDVDNQRSWELPLTRRTAGVTIGIVHVQAVLEHGRAVMAVM